MRPKCRYLLAAPRGNKNLSSVSELSEERSDPRRDNPLNLSNPSVENVETLLKLFALFEHGIETILKLLAMLERGNETRLKLFAIFEHGVETILKQVAILEVTLDAMRPRFAGGGCAASESVLTHDSSFLYR